MTDHPKKDAQTGSKAGDGVLTAGSQNIIVQAEQVMLQAAQQAARAKRDPARMLRVLALMAAPVYNPINPSRSPSPLDLRQEWHVLAEGVRKSGAPILLARLSLPTLDSLRYALSPRAKKQCVFPHILHFSGHAWREGLLLEDELGQEHPATAAEILKALAGLPQPLDLVVLNGCESAADAQSVAQALVNGGLARAVVGHERPVLDDEAVAFAARLYAELTGGFALMDAVDRAKKEVTTHEVILLGDESLRFDNLSGGEPIVDDRRQRGKLPSQSGHFYGRGRELVEISRSLAHPPAMVVLSGPPGIGKSSLVLEAAHRNGWRFPGGVAYAAGPRPDDASTTTAAEMLAFLADALELERTEDLLLYVSEKPTLLLLDNLESLPAEEMARLRDFLLRLGRESAAIVAMRPSCEALEELPSARPMPLHRGLVVEEAARYALAQANQRGIDLTWERALFIAGAVDGHPLLVEKLVSLAGRRDLDELLEEVAKKEGDFAEKIETVYSWSAARLDEAGLAAWTALQLFPAGSAPEGVLRAAAGKEGPQKLREAALADFDPSEQLWRWHATVAEYARCHWPISKDVQRSRLIELLPAWTEWLKRQPAGKQLTLFRLEASRFNLNALLEACPSASFQEARLFMDELGARLPLPDRTLSLRELAAKVFEAKLFVLPVEDRARRAELLNNLGGAFSALGQREAALEEAEEAMDIYRKLAESNPQAFLQGLAMSLNNLGAARSALGQRGAALEAAEEAMDIYRKLAESNPQAFLPDLAMSLNNLSSMRSALGQRETALEAAEEAVDIYRKLAESNPQAFLPDLARSLNNLNASLSALGKREAALEAAEEAVDVYRKLAKSNPQAFLPELAGSLNNLGATLSVLGQRKTALEAASESVDIYRKLAESNPQAFLPDLARSLNNLGNRLSALRQWKTALEAAEEAVEIRRKLAESNPQAFLPDLAASLNDLSKRLSVLGKRKNALEAASEALDIYRKLTESNPQAFLPDLARSLYNLGAALSALGKRKTALEATSESMDIYRKLAESNPQAFLPDLAICLGVCGSVLMTLDRNDEAARVFAEGLQHMVTFYLNLPQAFNDLVNDLRRSYLEACQKSGLEPDNNLLSQFN